ncbi:hypothetical protein HNY73_017744 [Argiope bruennichi]|nr:hypothetical protein HNY73_017744 [Argiope bruennichi]
MYASDDGFPLDELTIWDSLLGCLFYCLSFIGLLWMTTPLPDIQVHLFFIVSFEDRALGPEDREPQIFHIPMWHPAGGEGPVLNPPPPPPPAPP